MDVPVFLISTLVHTSITMINLGIRLHSCYESHHNSIYTNTNKFFIYCSMLFTVLTEKLFHFLEDYYIKDYCDLNIDSYYCNDIYDIGDCRKTLTLEQEGAKILGTVLGTYSILFLDNYIVNSFAQEFYVTEQMLSGDNAAN